MQQTVAWKPTPVWKGIILVPLQINSLDSHRVVGERKAMDELLHFASSVICCRKIRPLHADYCCDKTSEVGNRCIRAFFPEIWQSLMRA